MNVLITRWCGKTQQNKNAIELWSGLSDGDINCKQYNIIAKEIGGS